MKNYLSIAFATLLCIFAFTSCDEKTDPDNDSMVSTGEASYISPVYAIVVGSCNGAVLDDIDEQGFICSTNANPSYEKDRKFLMEPSYGDGPGMGQQVGQIGHPQGLPGYKSQFGDRMRCLTPGTKYYFCAFIKLKSSGEVILGAVRSFSTPALKEPEAVDLGLPSGTKWASCNVGANSPWETGGYYAWGEVAEKSDYVTYLHEGADIGRNIAGTGYDVARAMLGEKWSMPTITQLDELMSGCSFEWKDNYEDSDISGYLFKSKSNGKSIFFPAAGYINNFAITDMNATCRYYASTLADSNFADTMAAFEFGAPYKSGCVTSGGSTIRAVTK